MVVVLMRASTAVVIDVVRVLVWAAAVIDMVAVVEILFNDVRADVVIDTFTGVEIVAVGEIASALKFAVPISYCVDVVSAVVVNELTDALACVIMDFISGIAVEMSVDANVNVFKSLMTAFAVPNP